jgi:hypothetical protein
MSYAAEKLLSFVASHTSSKGNSIQQCEADTSYFGMTSLSFLLKLKSYFQLMFTLQLVMLMKEASVLHLPVLL